jgi:putative aldouronate transport system substrate-binding protein
MRQDWLDAIGESELPSNITFDKLEEIFTKFVENDPDNNGKKDTAALTKCWGINQQFALITGAFGLVLESGGGEGFQVFNGEPVYSPTLPEYRDLLAKLNDWYNKGIIDKEFATDTPANVNDKFATGKTGYVSGGMMNLTPTAGGASLQPVAALLTANPNAKIHYITKIIGPSGLSGSLGSDAAGFNWNLLFFKNVDDAKTQRILSVFDKMNSDPDIYKLAAFGIEGVHYNIVNGQVTSSDAQKAEIAKEQEEGFAGPGYLHFPL